jgi:Ca2+-binding RTX toxin-like protein
VDGDDVLVGGAGGDVLKGGSGNDTASYETSASGVVASLVRFSGVTADAVGDSYVSVENLSGSAEDDTLIGDGGENALNGLLGNDYIQGPRQR